MMRMTGMFVVDGILREADDFAVIWSVLVRGL